MCAAYNTKMHVGSFRMPLGPLELESVLAPGCGSGGQKVAFLLFWLPISP